MPGRVWTHIPQTRYSTTKANTRSFAYLPQSDGPMFTFMQRIKDYFELCSRSYLESDRPAFSGETRLCLAVCGRIFPKPGIRQQKQTPGHSHICPNKMDLCSLLCSESRTILNYAADQLYLERPASAWPCVHAR